jgi:hypothetical protein
MVESGTYDARIAKTVDPDGGDEVACMFGESENKGTPFVTAEFQIVGGEFDGSRVPWRGYFSGAASERVVESLVACGFVGEDIDAYPSQSPDKLVKIVVEQEEYDNKTNARVQWVNGPKRVKKLDTTGLKTLGASLKSIIASTRAGTVDESPKQEAPKPEPEKQSSDAAPPAETTKPKSKKKAPF